MVNPVISIIIPTYNRLEVLKKCLVSLMANDFKEFFEIIIINDGSTDNTFNEINNFVQEKNQTNYNIINIITQKNSGPSTARNAGVKVAKAPLLLIIGDDSIADKNLLNQHFIWNNEKYPQENIAILGYNEWSREIKITPLMRWIDASGLQFDYSRFKDENSPKSTDLWTCNISIKKSFLEKYGLFDEDFPFAAWEDVELGWRLGKHGFQIKYNKEAMVSHYHPTNFASIKKRMFNHGYSQKILERKMKGEYENKLFRQPLKFILSLFDVIITYTGVIYFFDKICYFLETRKIIPVFFLAVMHHYKLNGIRQYEKLKNHHS